MNKETPNYDLLTKYLLGEASESENQQVESWLKESQQNRDELKSLEQLVRATGSLSEPATVDTDTAWIKLKTKITKTEEGGKVINMKPQSGEGGGNFRRYFGIAATIAGLLIGAAILFQFLQTSQTDAVQFANITTTTQSLIETLPDGSVVTLNKNTTLTYPLAFTEGERRIKLTGEAFFDITKDPQKPFVIEAGEAEVKVLGTSFNVKAYEVSEVIEVIVETGRVQLSGVEKEESIILSPGNKGIYTKSSKELTQALNNDAAYAFWRSRKLTFRNTPLKEVVEIINNYYKANLSYEKESIGRCKLTATFEDDELTTILDILAMTFQLEIKESASGKILSGNGCSDESL